MKIRLSSFSIFLLTTWLLVEFLVGFYGYLSAVGGHSAALVAYRGLCGVYLLAAPFFVGVRPSRVVILVPVFALVFVLVAQLTLVPEQSFLGGLRYVYKVSLPFIVLFNIFWLKDIGAMKIQTVERITAVNAMVLLVNLSLKFFGIGYANYGESGDSFQSGTGFFYAGNEVSVTLIALFGLSLALIERKRLPVYLAMAVFCLGVIVLNTKTALIGFVCIALVKVASSIRRQWPWVSASLVMATLFFAEVVSWFQGAFEKLLVRWDWFTQEYGAGVVLLGGAKRLETISEQTSELLASPAVMLAGRGWSGVAENNFVDLLYGFGFVGFSIFLVWLLVGPAQYIAFLGRTPQSRLAVSSVTLVLLSLAALVAGHTVQSASLSVFWALLVALPCMKHGRSRRPHPRLVSAHPSRVLSGRVHLQHAPG